MADKIRPGPRNEDSLRPPTPKTDDPNDLEKPSCLPTYRDDRIEVVLEPLSKNQPNVMVHKVFNLKHQHTDENGKKLEVRREEIRINGIRFSCGCTRLQGESLNFVAATFYTKPQGANEEIWANGLSVVERNTLAPAVFACVLKFARPLDIDKYSVKIKGPGTQRCEFHSMMWENMVLAGRKNIDEKLQDPGFKDHIFRNQAIKSAVMNWLSARAQRLGRQTYPKKTVYDDPAIRFNILQQTRQIVTTFLQGEALRLFIQASSPSAFYFNFSQLLETGGLSKEEVTAAQEIISTSGAVGGSGASK